MLNFSSNVNFLPHICHSDAPAQFSITFLTPLGLTAEEARDARKRAEAETRETEAAVKLQEQREFLERKRLREEKMAEWVRVYLFQSTIEWIMEIDYLGKVKFRVNRGQFVSRFAHSQWNFEQLKWC